MEKTRPMDLQNWRKWKKYCFRFKSGKISTGQPLASILGKIGLNVKAIANEMNALTKGPHQGVKVEILFYVNKLTREYHMELGADTVTSVVLKQLKIEKCPGDQTQRIDVAKSDFNAIMKKVIQAKKIKTTKDLEKVLLGQFHSMRLNVK